MNKKLTLCDLRSKSGALLLAQLLYLLVAQLPEVLLRVLLKAQLLLQLLLLEGWGTWRGLPGQLSHNWPKKTRTNLQ
jgi:hypothetical protein